MFGLPPDAVSFSLTSHAHPTAIGLHVQITSRKLMTVLAMCLLSSVGSLLFHCSPAAVAGFIVPIHVDTVDAVFLRWSWPHVSEKVIKTAPPPVANLDAAATVVLVVLVVASRPQPAPSSIFRAR
jgi:hypothetical protein